nr:endonuclease [Cytophagales bacterium]
MNILKKILFYSLLVLSTGLILITLLSLIYDLRFWYYKILDFPRIQYLLLGILFLILFILLNKKWKLPSMFLLLGLVAVIIIHGIVIYPYLFGEKSVPDNLSGATNTDATFSLLLANVLVDNRKSGAFLHIVKQWDPDILLAMEVDDWWANELQVLKENFPYQLEYPLDNAYGMSLYSKLPIKNKKIRFLKQKDVPSFHLIITLPSGKSFNFHGIHPVAPVPSKKYPDNVGEEEVALLKIGKLVAENPLPSIVAGDFNDVSWSNTSRMFGQQGNLRNVRIGRGLYNTFDATSLIFRWPLDHYFVTEEFNLVELERLSKFGSDHFPLYARFGLDP